MTAGRFLYFFAATLALAQTPAAKRPIHIDGAVVDNETNAPIANARVTMEASENTDRQVTTSDPDGRFSFSTTWPAESAFPGLPLVFQAAAPGYLAAVPDTAPGIMAMFPFRGAVTVTHDESKYTTELRLTRVASLSGVLIDQDSKKPIAKLTVTAQHRTYQRGEAAYFPVSARPVTTGADGSFHFDGLSAGEYILQVQDPLKPKIEILPAGELPAPPEGALGYGNVILPGATAEYPEFASISVRAGAEMDIGQVPLLEQRLRNFIGTVDSDCRDSERVTIYLNVDRNSSGLVQNSLSQQIPCGPFRISNVPEGTYTVGLAIVGGRAAGYGSQPLGIRPGDPVHLSAQPRGIIKGVIEVEDTPADQFPKDLEGLFVPFMPKTMPLFAPDIPRDPSVNGKFGGVMYAGVTYDTQMRPPESYYLKRLFYKDVEQPDPSRFTTTPGVLDHSVRIILSPHPATFQAQVDPGNSVFLLQDGLDPTRRYTDRILLAPGPQQKSVIKRGLRPGSYHAFTIPTASVSSLELPGAIDQYLGKAQAVKLEEGQSTVVSFVSP
jgi:hypothetical protein